MIYVIEADDIDKLSNLEAELLARFRKMLDAKTVGVSEYRFAETSGIARTVYDEASLFLQTSPSQNEEEIQNQLQKLGIDHLAQQTISSLSGGWRKYVSYALRLTYLRRSTVPLVYFGTRYLDDRLIDKLLQLCTEHFVHCVFVELDTSHMDCRNLVYERVRIDLNSDLTVRNQNYLGIES